MIIEDAEFGEVIVRRNARARAVKFSISTSGRLAMSIPSRTTDAAAKRYLNASRAQIRQQLPVRDPATQKTRDYQQKVLRKKAKEYLPYRLEFLAKKFGYQYDVCKLGHQNTRWGSCTPPGTISLNIGLMKLPEALRDYVLIHELAHLNHPDHSKAFWAEVAQHDPNYKAHRKKLKLFEPGV